MKTVSVILAALMILIPAFSLYVSAEDKWIYCFDFYDFGVVTVTSPEQLDDKVAYTVAYNFAFYYLQGVKPPVKPEHGVNAHDFVVVNAITISHKYYPESPRCLEYIYKIGVCKECGKTFKSLVDQNRIYCCGNDDLPFEDVASDAWYYDAVGSCYLRGYMTGTSEKIFSPNEKLTRAMFALILAKVDGADLSGYTGKTVFKDVPENKWYSAAIMWAYSKGYTSGIGGSLYGVSYSVTRDQLAVFLYNYTKKKGNNLPQLSYLDQYSDKNEISTWAVDGMRWAVGAGIISGTTLRSLSPKREATRAEVAVVIKKYADTIKR